MARLSVSGSLGCIGFFDLTGLGENLCTPDIVHQERVAQATNLNVNV